MNDRPTAAAPAMPAAASRRRSPWAILALLAWTWTGSMGLSARAGENPGYLSGSAVSGEEQLKITGDGKAEIDLGRTEAGVPTRAGTLYVPAQTVYATGDDGVERRLKQATITVDVTNPVTTKNKVTDAVPTYRVTGLGDPMVFPDNGYAKTVTLAPGAYTATMTRDGDGATTRIVPVVVYGVFVSGQVAYSYGTPYLTHPLARHWKDYIGVNDGDADGDRIPDYADGHGGFGDASLTAGGRTTRDIVVQLQPGESLDEPASQRARVKFEYSASDPSTVQAATSEGAPGMTAYTPAAGLFRLWRYDHQPRAEGEPERNPTSLAAGGEWVPGDGVFTVQELCGSGTSVHLRLEGVNEGEGQLKVYYQPKSDATWSDDEETATAVRVNLSGDANLDGAVNAYDEMLEGTRDPTIRPGPIVILNNADLDRDGIVDTADGFNANPEIPASARIARDGEEEANEEGEGAPQNDNTPRPAFTPLTYTLAGVADKTRATVTITYLGADPAQVILEEVTDENGYTTYNTSVPTDTVQYNTQGRIRLWTKDATKARDKRPIQDGGDYIAPNSTLPANALPETLYAEGIATGEVQITISVDPDGEAGSEQTTPQAHPIQNQDPTHTDTIWVTVADLPRLTIHDAAPFPSVGNPAPARLQEDPTFVSVLENYDDDNHDGIRDNSRDVEGNAGIQIGDDDILTLRLSRYVGPKKGRLILKAEDAQDHINLFTADGITRLTLPLEINLANPANSPLAGLLADPLDLRLEGTAPSERITFTMHYCAGDIELVLDRVDVSVENFTPEGSVNRGSVNFAKIQCLEWTRFDGTNGGISYWTGGTFNPKNPLILMIEVPDSWWDETTKRMKAGVSVRRYGGHLIEMIPADRAFYDSMQDKWNERVTQFHTELKTAGNSAFLPQGQYSSEMILAELKRQLKMELDKICTPVGEKPAYLVTSPADETVVGSPHYQWRLFLGKNAAAATPVHFNAGNHHLALAHLDLGANTDNAGVIAGLNSPNSLEAELEDYLEDVTELTADGVNRPGWVIEFPGLLLPKSNRISVLTRQPGVPIPSPTQAEAETMAEGYVRFSLPGVAIHGLKGELRWTIPGDVAVWHEVKQPNGIVAWARISNAHIENIEAPIADPAQYAVDWNYEKRIRFEGLEENAGEIEVAFALRGANNDKICADVMRFTVAKVDLGIDSDNNGKYEYEVDDPIEESQPGKYIPVNDGDCDLDGIPDLADFNYASTDPNATSPVEFVEIILRRPATIQENALRVRLDYPESRPIDLLPVVPGGGFVGLPPPLPGNRRSLRLWMKDGSGTRNQNPIRAYDPSTLSADAQATYVAGSTGDFVPANANSDWYTWAELGGGTEITFYAEAVRKSDISGDVVISATMGLYQGDAPDIASGEIKPVVLPIFTDTVVATNATNKINLVVDSENTHGVNDPMRAPTHPDRETFEDYPIDIINWPGKLVPVNDGDVDEDHIPDYTDLQIQNVRGTLTGHFTPVVVELAPDVDLAVARIRFFYDQASPNPVLPTGTAPDLVYTPPSDGIMRLWTKNSHEARNAACVASGGDFLTKDTSFTPAQLGFGPTVLSRTIYIEGIKPSAKPADSASRIVARLFPDGDGPNAFHCEDAVRITVFKVDLSAAHSNDITEEHPGTPLVLNENWDGRHRYPGSDPTGADAFRELEPIWDHEYIWGATPADDPDLMEVMLILSPPGLPGAAALKLRPAPGAAAANQVRIWESRRKGTAGQAQPWTPGSAAMPDQTVSTPATTANGQPYTPSQLAPPNGKKLYVEGVATGRAELILEYQFRNPAPYTYEDKLNLDVVALKAEQGAMSRVVYSNSATVTFSVDGAAGGAYDFYWDLNADGNHRNGAFENANLASVNVMYSPNPDGPGNIFLDEIADNRRKTYAVTVWLKGGGLDGGFQLPIMANPQNIIRVALSTFPDNEHGMTVPDRRTNVPAYAPIGNAGFLDTISHIGNIIVSAGGGGYPDGGAVPLTITPVASGGTGASATARIAGGVVQSVTMTATGTGYMEPPVITVAGATPTTNATFTVNLAHIDSTILYTQRWFEVNWSVNLGANPTDIPEAINNAHRFQYGDVASVPIGPGIPPYLGPGLVLSLAPGGHSQDQKPVIAALFRAAFDLDLPDIHGIALHERRHAENFLAISDASEPWYILARARLMTTQCIVDVSEADASSLSISFASVRTPGDSMISWRYLNAFTNGYFLTPYNSADLFINNATNGLTPVQISSGRELLRRFYNRIPDELIELKRHGFPSRVRAPR